MSRPASRSLVVQGERGDLSRWWAVSAPVRALSKRSPFFAPAFRMRLSRLFIAPLVNQTLEDE